jgi:hypothetical protein
MERELLLYFIWRRRLSPSFLQPHAKRESRGCKVHAPFTSAVGDHLYILGILTPSARSRSMTWLGRRKVFDSYLVCVVFVVYKVALVEVFIHFYFHLSIMFHYCCVNRVCFTQHWCRIASVTDSVVNGNTSFSVPHRCAALTGQEGLMRLQRRFGNCGEENSIYIYTHVCDRFILARWDSYQLADNTYGYLCWCWWWWY